MNAFYLKPIKETLSKVLAINCLIVFSLAVSASATPPDYKSFKSDPKGPKREQKIIHSVNAMEKVPLYNVMMLKSEFQLEKFPDFNLRQAYNFVLYLSE